MIAVKSVLTKKLQVLDSNKNLILTGKNNISGSLLDIPLTPHVQPSQAANAIVHMNKIKKYFPQFLHAVFFSPAPSKFILAIKNIQFPTKQELIDDLISNHLSLFPATTKGY